MNISLNRILIDLPPFCQMYFFGREQRILPITMYGQAMRLRKFFNFLHEDITGFESTNPTNYRFCNLNMVRRNHIELYMEYLKNNKITPDTICGHLSTLNTFFLYFFQAGEIEQNPMLNIQPPRHDKEIIVTALNQAEIKKLLDAVDADFRRANGKRAINNIRLIRDKTILMLFLSTGIRLTELIGLDRNDVNLDDASFIVRRKGGRIDTCFMTAELKEQLEIYLQHYKMLPTDPLFTNQYHRRIKTRSIQILVEKHCKTAGIQKKITPHKLRSTFGTNMYERTRDIYIVADLLGHKDVRTTTSHYTRIKEELKREALQGFRIA